MSETLADLIDAAMAHEQVTSGRALGDIAERRGLALTHTQINHLRGGTYKSVPKRSTLEAIAALARVPLERAFTAAGVAQPGPPFAEELPPDVDLLAPHQRKAVIGVVRAFLQDVKENADGTPKNRAGDAGATVHQLKPPTAEDEQAGRAVAKRRRPPRDSPT